MPSTAWDQLTTDQQSAVEKAAQDEFSARGFSNSDLRTIASGADVTLDRIYEYFPEKLDLYAHIVAQTAGRIRDEMVRRLIALEPEHRPMLAVLENLITEWVDYFDDHPLELGITAAVNLEGDPAARHIVRETANEYYLEVLRPLLEDARQRGDLRSDADIDAFLALLLLVLPHLAVARHVPGLDPVLGLYGMDSKDAALIARRLMAVFSSAFGPRSI
ncbi:TetR/AcrR family transcriptional regulator [Parasphingorhabdus pacifica]